MSVTQTTAATFAATLVDEWVRAGVTDAVVSPGSRSTALVLALAGDPRLRVHVFVDERSAGFFALGLGLVTGNPAVAVTTSGTAAVELHPAVVEAHHARVPLVVCTADRPPELHDVGAPQTIDQHALYGRTLRFFADPGVPDDAASGSWRALAARAVIEARGRSGPAGPVHLNLPFREPLVGAPGPLPPGRAGGAPWHAFERRTALRDVAATELAGELAGRRGVLMAGAGAPREVQALGAALGWPVLADPRSSCRVPEPGIVAAFDALLRCEPFVDAHVPEIVVRFGGLSASGVLARWLSGLGVVTIAVDAVGAWADPAAAVNRVVVADPAELAAAVVAIGPRAAPGSWLRAWAAAESGAQGAFDEVLAGHDELSEPGVARALVSSLPDGADLFVSSSMPVRDVESYARPRNGVRVLANRGANGIDGVVASALGAAAGRRGRPIAALVGDLAFVHDSGALVGAARRQLSLVIVVVDNDGGGIFSFLPQASALDPEMFELFFVTPHDVDLTMLCQAHGVEVSQPKQAAELAPAIDRALRSGGVQVVLVHTERHANAALHAELNEAVALRVARLPRGAAGA